MNNRGRDFFKKIFFTISSNLISLVISTIVVLVVPKFIGVEEYGYWQLYSFYVTYVVFLHFGWTDGLYLKIAGKEYNKLNKNVLYSQFVMLTLLQIFISVLILYIGRIYIVTSERLYILRIISLMIIISNLSSFPKFVLQATSRLEEYSKLVILDRLTYIVIILSMLILGLRDYKLLLIADVIGRLIGLFAGMMFCSDIILRPLNEFKFSFYEAWENISIGAKVLLSYIASMLIIGSIRLGIERSWDISTFGKVSLTLSASSLMMVFISAIGIVVFPMLRNTDSNKLPDIYKIFRNFLTVLLFGLLCFYYPLKVFLVAWLPQYSESLAYMALVFPMFIYEGRMSLLINTYFKTLREEGLMLKVNIISLVVSIAITILTTQILRNLNMSIISIVCVLSIRSMLAEMSLSKRLKITLFNDIFNEYFLVVIFMISGWYFNPFSGLLVYFLSFVIYIVLNRKELNSTAQNLKNMISSRFMN
jgi:O-antigen/teichoic acid export membrane protein